MGGRGGRSGSGLNARTAQNNTILQHVATQLQNQNQNQNNIQNQAPSSANTGVIDDILDNITNLDDDSLAKLYTDSQKINLPNHLNDARDVTQHFVYAIGMNGKPTILDNASFNKFMSDNNIPRSEILSRSVNGGTLTTSAGNSVKLTPQDVVDMMQKSAMNYVGGKHGGQAYGAGTYFDMNGGANTGYGGTTVNAVLNPQTARVISDSKLGAMARAFDKAHPKFAKATGGYNTRFNNNNKSIYAIVMGYNVIASNGGYHNVIDRTALVYRQ